MPATLQSPPGMKASNGDANNEKKVDRTTKDKRSDNGNVIRDRRSPGSQQEQRREIVREQMRQATGDGPSRTSEPRSAESASLQARKEYDRGTQNLESRQELSKTLEDGDVPHNPIPNGQPDLTNTIAPKREREGLKEKQLKLSPEKILELTSSPESLPMSNPLDKPLEEIDTILDNHESGKHSVPSVQESKMQTPGHDKCESFENTPLTTRDPSQSTPLSPLVPFKENPQRPVPGARAVSTSALRRRSSASKGVGVGRNASIINPKNSKPAPPPLRFQETKTGRRLSELGDPEPSPMPTSIPIPPVSLPTYLQLELSSQRPSPLYIHRSVTSDFPYESSRVKIERLLNFLLLPLQLERVLWFGALACLDAWLYSFTILPLRFLKALSILASSWGNNAAVEARFLLGFIYAGLGRMWRRRRSSVSKPPSFKTSSGAASDTDNDKAFVPSNSLDGGTSNNLDRPSIAQRRHSAPRRHRRTKSMPSALLPDHKADILKGLLILLSCSILMYFDASRMYHSIRGQAAIKLYVIYNVLEVCDRLFSALGQDVLECLFSKEALERKPDGRSKILRPFWLFVLALAYNLVHATALFYQVITLNVAVNSYSNALLTLLMSNQFVEIKSTVFKKFEKENLFQLTCADVVERFQLWLMLTIIASRNVIETGGLMANTPGRSDFASAASSEAATGILPKSFTLFPTISGQILGPFFLVLGSEMLVDWVKHAYITKFNNTKPVIYGRFFDVLAKDYYSHAFADQNLTKRLGLPVIPLACLFIRASVQTYHMFLATHLPLPLASPSRSLSVSADDPTSFPSHSPYRTISLDFLFRRALGRASPAPDPLENAVTTSTWLPWTWTPDDLLTFLTTAVFFSLIYLALLAIKLILGMSLLSCARYRYRGMKERESVSIHAEGRRVGGWGVVEVDDDKRRWIYADDPDGARRSRERERDAKVRADDPSGFEAVERYSMVGKRIW